MNELTLHSFSRRSLLLRLGLIPLVATLNFAINLFQAVVLQTPVPSPAPPGVPVFLIGLPPAVSWVLLSIPVQLATRRLSRERRSAAVLGHLVVATGFVVLHSPFVVVIREALGTSNPALSFWPEAKRHLIGNITVNLLVYAAIVGMTLAWDNWRLSAHRKATAEKLAAELTRAELSALRSKMQPHFLFNALHGISSVMETDVVKARQMMVALSHLLRTSLHVGSERSVLEQEVRFARDYLDLQHMRFEDRLRYDMEVTARAHLQVPSFILQPLVENAVIHGMGDRSEATMVNVNVRELGSAVEIEVIDDGPGFPNGVLDGSKPLGVGLSALRARLHALPNGRGALSLSNRPGGGAQVIVRVPTHDEDGANG